VINLYPTPVGAKQTYTPMPEKVCFKTKAENLDLQIFIENLEKEKKISAADG
jgi:hypothetical protein